MSRTSRLRFYAARLAAAALASLAMVSQMSGDRGYAKGNRPTCLAVPSGIVAWLDADEITFTGTDTVSVDAAANNNNGTLRNGATSTASGRVNSAFLLDGVNDFVNVPDAPSLNPTKAITLDAWVNPASLKDGDIIGKDGEGFERQYLLGSLPTGRFRAHVGVPSGFMFIDSTTIAQTGVWYHVAMTYDGAALRLYVNGVMENALAVSGDIITTPQPLRIGGGAPAGLSQNHFNGRIDEAQVFDRVLSQGEIQAIFNAASAGQCACITLPATPTNMVTWLRGNGNANDTAGGNNGTLVGGATFTTSAGGKVGQAFQLDGDGDFVLVPNAPSLNPTTAITLDAWVFPTSGVDGDIIGKDGEGFERQYLLGFQPTRQVRAHVGVPSGFRFVDGTTQLPLNAWTHVAMTYDGVTLRLYVNGAQEGSLAVSGNIITTPQPLRIGGGAPAGQQQNYFLGRIDEAQLFNRVLSQTEIQEISDAGSAGQCNVGSISGSVTNVNGRTLDDATVSLTENFSQIATAGGAYTFRNLRVGGNYTVSPSRSDVSNWSPFSQTFNPFPGNSSADFQAQTPTPTISGQIVNAPANVSSVVMVKVNGSGLPPNRYTCRVQSDGRYICDNLNVAGDYVIIPESSQFVFTPSSRTFNNLPGNFVPLGSCEPTSNDFFCTAFRADAAFTISGRITSGGNALADVTLTLTGGANFTQRQTTTDANGNYSFATVPGGSNYTVIPTKDNFNFSPQSLPIDNLSTNVTTANFTASPLTAVIQITTPAPVGEAEGRVTLTVTRSGLLTGVSNVNYATTDGTATERKDYTAAIGRLRFAAGETAKTFEVIITDDRFDDDNESFTVTLSNPVGTTLGAQSTAAVSITDNDPANGPSPVKDASIEPPFFVRQHYADFLGRVPDTDGLNFWVGQAMGCGTSDLLVCRINVSAAFFLSIENQETGYLVHRAYKVAYGNLPGKPVPLLLREYLAGSRQIGEGVQVGVGNWQQQLESNKAAFFNEFLTTSRFTTRYNALTNTQFVEALNQNASGALSTAERETLINALNGGTMTRAQVVRAVAEDADFAQGAERNRAFVLAQYFGYLRRNPDDVDFRGVPDPTFDGYNFWLGKLNEFNGNFIQAEMVRAFIQSIEYGERFGQ